MITIDEPEVIDLTQSPVSPSSISFIDLTSSPDTVSLSMSNDFDMPYLVAPPPLPPLELIRIALPIFNIYMEEMSDEEIDDIEFVDSPQSPPFQLEDGSVVEFATMGG